MNNSDILNNQINDRILQEKVNSIGEEHLSGNAYSAEMMQQELVEQMKVVRERIKNIQSSLQKNEENKKNLLIELRKNENIFESLMKQTNSIKLGMSVNNDILKQSKKDEKNIAKNDKKLDELDKKIVDKERELKELGSAANGLSARRFKKREERIKSELSRLKEKRGTIQQRQRKIINSRLESYFKKVDSKSRKYGKTHAIEELRLERNSSLEERMNIKQNKIQDLENKALSSGRIKGSVYSVRGKVSYVSKGALASYCKLLSKKDGVLNSMRRVDKSVIDRVHRTYGDDFVNGGRGSIPNTDIVQEEENVIEEEIFVDNTIVEDNSIIEDNTIVNNNSNDMEDGIRIDVPLGLDVNSIIHILMIQKQYGNHCYAIFNDIKLDNFEFDSEEEMLESYNEDMMNKGKGMSR